jgi:hypothetical protein
MLTHACTALSMGVASSMTPPWERMSHTGERAVIDFAACTLPVTIIPLFPSDVTPGSRLAMAPLALVAPVPPAVSGTSVSPLTVVPLAV